MGICIIKELENHLREKVIFQTLFLLVAALVTGCSSVKPIARDQSVPLETFKRAYVVTPPGSDLAISGYLQAALSERGVATGAGALTNMPSDAQFYVTYQAEKGWDWTVYLMSLNVKLVLPSTGKVFAEGEFQRGVAIHSYPDPREKAFEVIDSIYKAK